MRTGYDTDTEICRYIQRSNGKGRCDKCSAIRNKGDPYWLYREKEEVNYISLCEKCVETGEDALEKSRILLSLKRL